MAMSKPLADFIYANDNDTDLSTGFAVLVTAVATAAAAVRAVDNGDNVEDAARDCKDTLTAVFAELGLLPKTSNDDYDCDGDCTDCDCDCGDDPWDDEDFFGNDNDDDYGHKTDGRKTVSVRQLRDNLGRGIGVRLTIPSGCTDDDIRDALYAVVERYED